MHAHRGGAVHTAGLSDAAGLWRDVEIESKAECRAVGRTPVPRIDACVAVYLPKLLSYFTAEHGEPVLVPIKDRHERSEVPAAILHVQP